MGYVGFGISQNGGMIGADIVVVRGANDDFTATSMTSTAYAPPVADAVNPWKFVESNQQNGESYFVVQRKAGGCDENLVNLKIQNLEQRFIFAFGRTQDFLYHSVNQRYSAQLNLFQNDIVVGPPPDLPHFDVFMSGYEVPLEVDSFICTTTVLPIELTTQKYHIVAIEPIINHVGVAHHFASWSCPRDFTPPVNAAPDGSWDCLDMEAVAECELMPYIWTAGAPLWTLPEHVGIPLGLDGAQNIVIQMHNNNPTFQSGIYDTSGIRLYYTTELREVDAGVITLGNNATPQGLILPPLQEEVHVVSDCPERCTAGLLEPITIFSIHWHMHQVGKDIEFRIIREGVEILHLSMDHWDYNWQGYYEVDEFEILPNDRLITECRYDTRTRTDTTYGGDGTQDEMCYIFLSSYPAHAANACLSLEMQREDQPHEMLCLDGNITSYYSEPFEPLEEVKFCNL
eukprot:TRINITY_DN46_c0_g1_i2.p1 TRINITY_DN46_c0_g1~~TRINITY_DN46_c0_g1_i2.p1  ORF type:complete len:457 (-),score=113.46 TRINITY_DN46_c0_g1_i2:98-1468(-)